jgi:hypothetical protein
VTPAALATADCERIRDGLIGQPANAASSLAYVAAGAALIARARSAPPGRRAWLVAFGAATAANGVGGVSYHGPGGAASRWVHDTALLATLGLMAFADIEHMAGDTRWHRSALAVVAAGGLLAVAPDASSAAQVVLGAAVAASEGATYVTRRRAGRPGLRRRFAPLVVTGGVAVAIYAASRSGGPLCRPDSLLQGHAAWHVLTALLLWWWGREELGSAG